MCIFFHGSIGTSKGHSCPTTPNPQAVILTSETQWGSGYLKDERTLKCRGPIPIYYVSLYGIIMHPKPLLKFSGFRTRTLNSTPQIPRQVFKPQTPKLKTTRREGNAQCSTLGVRIRGTLGDIDPLNKVPSPLREPEVGFRRVPL